MVLLFHGKGVDVAVLGFFYIMHMKQYTQIRNKPSVTDSEIVFFTISWLPMELKMLPCLIAIMSCDGAFGLLR